MKRLLVCTVSLLLALPAAAGEKENERLQNAAEVLGEILNIPEGIPQELLDKAECVVVIPSVKKAALGIGGSYGRGATLCRSGEEFEGAWTPPAMFRLEGGNIGFQIGGQATDYVMLVMNQKGVNSLLRSKVKLGADASAVAGPKGRAAMAATDAFMRAEILSYSRSRGLFAGVSLEGSTLRQDSGANQAVYGHKVSARRVLREGAVSVPRAGRRLVSLLNEHSPRNRSE